MCVVNKIIKIVNYVSYLGVWYILIWWKYNILVVFFIIEFNKIMFFIIFIWVLVSIINFFF